MTGVNVVVSCTKRKAKPPLPGLRAGGLPAGAAPARAAEWLRRLRQHRHEALPASSLYGGDHWRTAMGLQAILGPAGTVRLWICSAGYGLVRPEAPLAPYEATFTPSAEDAVAPSLAEAGEWWRLLAAWEGPGDGPRTLAALADKWPDDFLLVALPREYLAAVAEDLREAASCAAERLAVISAGTDALPGLEPNLLPCDARLQKKCGGPLSSLNARLARDLLGAARAPLSLRRCRALFASWLRAVPEEERRAAVAQSDERVLAYIRSTLKDAPDASASAMLRDFRDSGRSCEQKRFGRLHAQARGAKR